MSDGQVAGLCHFAKDTSTLALEFTPDKKVTKSPLLTTIKILLRSSWELDRLSAWSYSVDGNTFISSGDSYQLSWGSYRGDRIGIFTDNSSGEKGQVDVDWFHCSYASPVR